MVPPAIRSRTSTKNSRVQLLELAPTDPPPASVSDASTTITPRRSTRSTPLKRLKSESLSLSPAPSPEPDFEDPLPGPSTPKKPKVEPTTPDKTKSATPKKAIKLSLDKPHPEPKNWKRQYELIEKMRAKIIAPVDGMGCDTPNRERSDDPKTIRFHMLISLMLSSQTKDPVTTAAVTLLHTTLPGGLTAPSLAAASHETISECINKVGFWRRKTEYISEAAKRILEGGLDDGEPEEAEVVGGWAKDAEGDIPRTLGGLCKLRGVGPKMAFLALSSAWGINIGIGVDVHVHRITNRLGWHKPKTSEPEQTRLNLQSWLPSHLFKPINHTLVGFGQVVCVPVGPRCDVCLLGREKICPSRVAGVKGEGRKEVAGAEAWMGVEDANVQAEGLGEDGLMKMEEEEEKAIEVPGIDSAEDLREIVQNELKQEAADAVVTMEV